MPHEKIPDVHVSRCCFTEAEVSIEVLCAYVVVDVGACVIVGEGVGEY